MIYIDDTADRDPSALTQFQQCLLFSPLAQDSRYDSHPVLLNFSSHLNDMYKYFHPLSANCIVSATLEFVTGCALETMETLMSMPLHSLPRSATQREELNLYPYYLRAKTGVSPAYAYMLFPEKENPKMEMYLEAIPEICMFIDKTNDVLSYVLLFPSLLKITVY